MGPASAKSASPAPPPDQPVHGPVRSAQHQASGIEPGCAGPVPSCRLTPGHDTTDPATAPKLNQNPMHRGLPVESRRSAWSRRGFHQGAGA
jgi:hypothetical protein